MSRSSRKALRAAFVAAIVLAAIAVASPVASAAKRRTLMPVACTPTPAHWVYVDDDLGVPWLQFVPAIRCTDAADAPACPAGSPHPGWVQVTDDLGIPYLVPTGSESDAASSCSRTTQAQDGSQPGTTTASPYRGWVYVTNAAGIPTLVPLSDIR